MVKKLLTTFVMSLCLLPLFAQSVAVTGVVTAADDGLPLPQLAIQVKGEQRGVVTDAQGRYNITVPSAASVLIFSYTGSETQEIEVRETKSWSWGMVRGVRSVRR